MIKSDDHEIVIAEIKPGDFQLTVLFAGQRFECGSYLTRIAASQAGRLMVERKRGEQKGQKKRPRGKQGG